MRRGDTIFFGKKRDFSFGSLQNIFTKEELLRLTALKYNVNEVFLEEIPTEENNNGSFTIPLNETIVGYKIVNRADNCEHALLKLRIPTDAMIICGVKNGECCCLDEVKFRTDKVFVEKAYDINGRIAGTKLRASEIKDLTQFYSNYDINFHYEIGKYVGATCSTNEHKICESGLHFFMTPLGAVQYAYGSNITDIKFD